MRDLSFYRGWLLAPLVAPLVVAVLGTFTPAPPEPLLSASIYLTMSLFFGALPYALLVVILWRWLPGQSPGRVRAMPTTSFSGGDGARQVH